MGRDSKEQHPHVTSFQSFFLLAWKCHTRIAAWGQVSTGVTSLHLLMPPPGPGAEYIPSPSVSISLGASEQLSSLQSPPAYKAHREGLLGGATGGSGEESGFLCEKSVAKKKRRV